MNAEDLQPLIHARPFVPFTIHMSNGEQFTVRHPELLMVGRRTAVLGIAASPDSTVYDHATYLSLIHIVRAEPIRSAAGGGNGQSGAA